LPPSTMQVSAEDVVEAQDGKTEPLNVANEANSDDGDASDSGLAQFLIERACRNSVIANYFYWYLMIECEDHEDTATMRDQEREKEMYLSVLKRFKVALKSGPQEYRERANFLKRQHTFV